MGMHFNPQIHGDSIEALTLVIAVWPTLFLIVDKFHEW